MSAVLAFSATGYIAAARVLPRLISLSVRMSACTVISAGKQVLELEAVGRTRRSKMAAVLSAVAAMMLIALLAHGSSQVALLPVVHPYTLVTPDSCPDECSSVNSSKR